MDHVNDEYFVVKSNNREISCEKAMPRNSWRKFHTRPISKYVKEASIRFDAIGCRPENFFIGVINIEEDTRDKIWDIKKCRNLYAFRLTYYDGDKTNQNKNQTLVEAIVGSYENLQKITIINDKEPLNKMSTNDIYSLEYTRTFIKLSNDRGFNYCLPMNIGYNDVFRFFVEIGGSALVGRSLRFLPDLNHMCQE